MTPKLPEHPVAWLRAPYGTIEPNPLFKVSMQQTTDFAVGLYAADQMREMWKQGMERAADVCDELAAQDKLSNYYKVAALAIRKEITP